MAETDQPASSSGSNAAKRRVEFLARIKYSNNLPPPPFAPKPVLNKLDLDPLLTAASLSSVFLQRELNPEPDIELGIPLDLSTWDEAFDPVLGPKIMCPEPLEDHQLDSEDLLLLGEPEVSGTANSKSKSLARSAMGSQSLDSSDKPSSSEIGMGTSFLRRTAYMTGETRRTSKRKVGGQASANSTNLSIMEAEVKRIEQTFADARKPLDQLRHPTKRNVTAVSAVPLLPDSHESDLNFMEVKLLGSASLRNIPDQLDANQLRGSVFYHNKAEVVGQPVEWLSFFVPKEDASRLVNYRKELRDTLSAEEAQAEEQSVFYLEKLQENDFSVLKSTRKFEEMIISKTDDSYVCVPVSARYSLRRRRLDQNLSNRIRNHEFDVLDLKLSELTPKERMQRDEVRSIYDPVNYG